jgi:ABC-type Fe3+/spermidine/putrescine transport system ATPase subunit
VKETGLTVVMVSHDPAEVLSMADDLIVIKQGEILEEGTPKALYQYPQNLYTAQLLSNCNVLTAAEAKLCHIEATKEYAVIYPEWIKLKLIAPVRNWTVREVQFKGFFENLILEQNGTLLRVVNEEADKYHPGDKVAVRVGKWLEY